MIMEGRQIVDKESFAKYFVVILIACFAASKIDAQSLTLQKAVELALQNNDRILQYKEKLQQKTFDKRSSLGNLLPQISLSSSYTHLNDPLTMDLEPIRRAMISLHAKDQVSITSINSQLAGGPAINDPSSPVYQTVYQKVYAAYNNALPEFVETLKEQNYPSLSIAAVQPIFTGGKIRAGIKAAESEKSAAKFELKQIENEVIKETAGYYIATILARDVVEVRKEVLSAMNKHRDKAEKLYSQGIIAKYHLLRAEVAVSEANRNLISDQNRLEIVKLALKKCMNSDSFIPEISDSLLYKPVTDSLNHFLSETENHQPVYSIVESKRNLAHQKTASQISAFLPSIAVFGKYEFFKDYLSALEPQWAVGVTANLPIFNGFKNYNNYKSSRHLEKELQKFESAIKDDISLLVEKTYRDMRNNQEQFILLSADINLAEENLRQCKSRFENGYGTSLEVIDAQLVLEKNRIERLIALHNYYKSYIDLSTATGNLEPVLEICN